MRVFPSTGGRRAGTATAACIAMAALAGCGSSGSTGTAGSTTGNAASSGKLQHVSVGLALLPPKMTFIGFYVAQDEGFFRKNGLDVKLEGEGDGVKSLRATASGSIDMGATSADDVIAADVQGGGIKAVWSYAMPLDTTMIADQTVKTPADLKGKNIGITDPGGFSDVQARAVLARAHVPASAVHLISLPQRSAFVPSLVSGRISSAPFHVDDGYTAEDQDSKLHLISSLYQVLPNWWYGAIDATSSYVQSHGDTIKRFITAMVEADRWMYTHRDQTIAIGTKYTMESKPVVARSYDFLAKANEWTTNQGLEQNRVMSTMNYEKSIGIIPKVPSYNTVADLTYADAVIGKLGKDSRGF